MVPLLSKLQSPGQEAAACVRANGATVSAPAALTFTSDDKTIIAVSGKDNSVLQWSMSRS